jgi:hypothetical protein
VKAAKFLGVAAIACLIVLACAWGTLAVYFGGNGGGGLRTIGAVAFIALSFAAWLFGRRKKLVRLIWLGAFCGVIGWFVSIRPSQNRNWKREVAEFPRVHIEGDRISIAGCRNFSYRSREDFDVKYETRELSLSHLAGVDLFISYWEDGPMAHTFLSFRFDNAEPLCVSIEARPEQGESFAALPSLFKRFELIYVVGDERDIVRVRTNHRGEQVYLYPIAVSAETARRLFLVYADKINRLADKPVFYHLLKNNCTANIVYNAREAGQKKIFDIRFVLNGLVDRYLYEAELVDRSLPFAVLREKSRITDAAKSADLESFSQSIRRPKE